MKRAIGIMFAVICIAMGASAFAGPLDNAMEFQEKAAGEAEAGNQPSQSSDGSPISWSGDSSGTDGAVNIGEAGSPNTSTSGQ